MLQRLWWRAAGLLLRRVEGSTSWRRRSWRDASQLARWAATGAPVPAPSTVKQRILSAWSLPGSPWIETGTFRGDMTAYLAGMAPRVVSLEPMPDLFAAAAERFRDRDEIILLQATSQSGMDRAVDLAGAGDLNFWLDGHFSGGETFAGEEDTPILFELERISRLLATGRRAAVFIDDVRLFATEHREIITDETRRGYPPLDALVDWARGHRLSWSIEHDIFIARSR